MRFGPLPGSQVDRYSVIGSCISFSSYRIKIGSLTVNAPIQVSLNGTQEQVERLRALQIAFADVCNAIAPVVQQTRCWNRVALHHLVYHPMRDRYPGLGSQMICNAIYSVCRNARLVLQHPKSPWNILKRPNATLPLLRFAPNAPVYFDRHTLSLKAGALSMFTLDGRMRFNVQLSADEATRFHSEKLVEVMLVSTPAGFDLRFQFAAPGSESTPKALPAGALLPDYVDIVPPAVVPVLQESGRGEPGFLQTAASR